MSLLKPKLVVADSDANAVRSWLLSRSEKTTKLKFSECLSSPIVKFVVGPADNRIAYLIHVALAEADSEYVRHALRVPMQEAAEAEIRLESLDPYLFGFYVEYLYRDGWLFNDAVLHETVYVTLVKLYALGDYLQASEFQRAAYAKFAYGFSSVTLADHTLCALLEMVFHDLPERSAVSEDNLRKHILHRAATQLSKLRHYDRFSMLLEHLPELSRELLMTHPDANSTKGHEQPSKRLEKLKKFSAESTFGAHQTEDGSAPT
ncbi:hypothetical protein EJ05DRAFT_500425 [Pseudovirgaria hyperparasitica]|uniref:BTB domain-containing protein n=1 Tax=Pseudovirgaria hyperparasitica TaxID=470096 RepID=A0A6A6W9X8_9PEZI|nr:uncharacterized protein EJ05DRAFT_500425 [Pseudovirgaria hyperparasitica]KAF2757901.1 hypothetical protein EJ05DRAFT_500425 [Pseudovirgaria hyperparasitica]